MLTRTAALMSFSFSELTQALIWRAIGVVDYFRTWYSVILRCCWMMRRSAGLSHLSQ